MAKTNSITKAMTGIDLNLDKKGLNALGKTLCTDEMNEGYADPLDRLAQVKQMQEILKGYEAELKPHALDKLSYEDNHKCLRGRAHIEQANTGDRLNYKGDPKYVELVKAVKFREEQLKNVFKGMQIVDEDGEEVPKIKVSTFGSITPKVTIK